jgi:hypothetical protein
MWQIVIRLAWNCHTSLFSWMLELSMTSFGDQQIPTVIPEQPEDVAHLHSKCILSHVEPEIHYIAFLHDVVFPFQSG